MIDHERLAGMEADFGEEEVAMIVAAFIEEATGAMARLRTGWHDDEIRDERLHFLKGCARTIGAVRLGNLCERLERVLPGPDDPELLAHEVAMACAALRQRQLRKAG